MLKKILACTAMLWAAAAFSATDVNKASAAELDDIKGIGPSLSGKILEERKKGNFKDWGDFVGRVPGIGEGNATKFSAAGLTVNGSAFKPGDAPPKAAADGKAKKAEKKADDRKADAKPAKADAAASKS